MDDKKMLVSMEEVIVAALLKLDELDPLDISLIVGDIRKNSNFEVSFDGKINDISKYLIYYADGRISPFFGSLNYYFNNDGCTLRDKMKAFVPSTLLKYFSDFSLKNYLKQKSNFISSSFKLLKKKGNILLISSNDLLFDDLVIKGFEKIDLFSSISSASEYFMSHESELPKYQVVIMYVDNHNMTIDDKEFISKINSISSDGNTLFFMINYYDNIYISSCYDSTNEHSWVVKSYNCSEVIDSVMMSAIINRITEKMRNYKNVVPSRLLFPSKCSELKIAFCSNLEFPSISSSISELLGIDVTCIDLNNESGFLMDNKFDIVIAPGNSIFHVTDYAKVVANSRFKLIVLYDINDLYDFENVSFGKKINLNGQFCDNIDMTSNNVDEAFRLITMDSSRLLDDISFQSILEVVISLYNNILVDKLGYGIRDMSFKSADYYDKKYQGKLSFEIGSGLIKNNAKAKSLILDFQKFSDIILKYLKFVNKGLITKSKNFVVSMNDDLVTVKSIYNGQVICVLSFFSDTIMDDYCSFDIQFLNKKGNLSVPSSVEIYISDIGEMPLLPNESETNAILSLFKKVDTTLEPLVKYATSREKHGGKKKKISRK